MENGVKKVAAGSEWQWRVVVAEAAVAGSDSGGIVGAVVVVVVTVGVSDGTGSDGIVRCYQQQKGTLQWKQMVSRGSSGPENNVNPAGLRRSRITPAVQNNAPARFPPPFKTAQEHLEDQHGPWRDVDANAGECRIINTRWTHDFGCKSQCRRRSTDAGNSLWRTA
jgi:hypothetical protein